MTSAPAIGFEYRPTRWRARLIYLIALLSVTSILLCGLPVAVKIALLAASLALVFYALRRLPSAVKAVAWSGERGWMIYATDGSDEPAELVSCRIYPDPIGIFLHLRGAKRKPAGLWLTLDNSDADTRRRLRMRLGGAQTDKHSDPE